MARATPILLGFFFVLATGILMSTGIALLWPGTVFDAIWQLRPDRHALLTPFGDLLGPGFLAMAVIGAIACIGCALRREWARKLALGIFIANGLGDAVQLALGHYLEGLVGIIVASLLVVGLTRAAVRKSFA